MSESIQHKLDRIRKPRVHITYDVHVGDSIQKKEIPYVIGILADLSGMPKNKIPAISKSKFINIDRDNINDVLKSSNARLSFSVKNKIDNSSEDLSIELEFKRLKDFDPISLVEQTPALYHVYKKRIKLLDLVAKMENYDVLRDIVKLLAEDIEFRNQFKDFIVSKKKNLNIEDDADKNDTDEDETDILNLIKQRIKLAEEKIRSQNDTNPEENKIDKNLKTETKENIQKEDIKSEVEDIKSEISEPQSETPELKTQENPGDNISPETNDDNNKKPSNNSKPKETK